MPVWELLPAPSSPLSSQLQAEPQSWELGSGLRDAVLSPGSCESESFLFLAYIICVDGEHCESPSSLHASPGRTDARPEPGSLALLQASRVTMAAL